ncbi:MAG: Tetratricopeptide repeat-containing protein [Candidatus Acidoferrum typicum]|nr:Tetratricopeptide repeat-containing protein [Candidatus Acidoferrum typicum]
MGQADAHATTHQYVISVQNLKLARKGRAAFEKGSQLLDKGDTLGSIAYLEHAIEENPEHYMAYYDLGVAHFRSAQQPKAEQAFQKAIDLTKGNFAPPQVGLGAILCQKANFPEALPLLERALDLEPGSAIGKYYLGWAQFGLNRLIEAERTLEQALLRDANFAQAYFLLARIHYRQHNLPAMLKDLECYLKLEPRKQQVRSLAEQVKREMAQDTSVFATARP